MATIFWKTAAPFGTCRSRYKARRAEVVAARQREKKLLRKIGALLSEQPGVTLSQKMRRTCAEGNRCPHCDLPATHNRTACSFCRAAIKIIKEA